MTERGKVQAVFAVTAFLLAAGAAIIWSTQSSPVNGNADPQDVRQVTLGEPLYREYCGSCHGVNLEGQPSWKIRNDDGRLPAPPHDDTGHTWHHPDAHLFRVVKLGLQPPLVPVGYESDMPAFGGILSDDEIWAVLSFIKSTWTEKSADFQSRIDRQYREANDN